MSEGRIEQAGEGVSDEEMVRQVEGQTSSDLQAEPAFESESGGAADDTDAASSPTTAEGRGGRAVAGARPQLRPAALSSSRDHLDIAGQFPRSAR